ncbi:MAG: hypothetical protein ACK46X_10215 [Candidatus Sericytochromatia bacterium]
MSFWRWLLGTGPAPLVADRAEVHAPERLTRGLMDPERFASGLGLLHEAMEDLFGLPTGNRDRLIVAHEEGTYGALWAYADCRPGHHVGIPAASWPMIVNAANRRQVLSPMVHEIGHVAFWWDWDSQAGAHYLMWPGAVEGLATPTGTYACVRHRRVPAWSDYPDAQRDWASADDWAAQWINQGVEARRGGASGQDSVDQAGHGQGAAIVEAAVFDLVFNRLGGYGPLRTVYRGYVANRRTPAQVMRSDQEKMEDFFTALGQAAGRDLSGYLAAWGFEVPELRRALATLPVVEPVLPTPVAVAYGPVVANDWA